VPATLDPPISAVPEVRTVTPLDPHEVYRGQVFHAGLLWEGHSVGTVDDYRIDVHDPETLAVIASAPVPHTLEFLYAYAPRTILAVGKHFDRRRGWLTYHSTVRFDASRPLPRLHVQVRTMPRRLQVEQFGGSAGRMWFNEIGSRKVFRWNGWWARPLRADVHLPGAMIPSGRHLFVLERNDFRPGNETIARIDTVSHDIERTFPETRRHLTMMIDLEGFPWIAAPEAWADQVLLVDKATNRLAATLPVPGTPVAVARLGTCLVVVAAGARQASFFDLATAGFPLVARWDLSGLGHDCLNVRSVQIDPHSGRLFLRSPFHQRVCGNTPAVRVAIDPDGATFARCTGAGVRPTSPRTRGDGHAVA
jgi:hypothetical protein